MLDIQHLNLQFITDEDGKKRAVILSIEEFQELLDDIEDLAVLAERREEPTISHSQLRNELKRDETLPD